MNPSNILLMTVDSLRCDAVARTRADAPATPHIDDLARCGVSFRQAIANGPRTQASFPSIMSSTYPLVGGEREGVPDEMTTLAEAVYDAGFATAAFNPSNPFLTREAGYDRGFDLFVDFWDVHPRADDGRRPSRLQSFKRSLHNAMGRRSLGFLMLFQAAFERAGGQHLTGETIARQALEWMGNQNGPFFVWLHFMDVHYPYTPLAGCWGVRERAAAMAGMVGLMTGRRRGGLRRLRALYDDRVGLMDRILGDIVSGLRAAGLFDRTLIAFTADHGEQFREHGGYAHGPELYEELLRVPLILTGPGVPADVATTEQVSLLGLAPTLLDLVGVEPPGSFSGSSFAPLVEGRGGAGEEFVFSEAMHSGGRQSRTGVPDVHRIMSCRTPGWKFIRDAEGPAEELYDLAGDPSETTNLAADRPDKVAELGRELDRHAAAVDAAAATVKPGKPRERRPADDEMRRRLAALGYL